MAEAEPEPEMAAATSAAGSRAGSGKSRTMGMSASAPVLQNSPYAATVGKPMRRPKVWVPPPGAFNEPDLPRFVNPGPGRYTPAHQHACLSTKPRVVATRFGSEDRFKYLGPQTALEPMQSGMVGGLFCPQSASGPGPSYLPSYDLVRPMARKSSFTVAVPINEGRGNSPGPGLYNPTDKGTRRNYTSGGGFLADDRHKYLGEIDPASLQPMKKCSPGPMYAAPAHTLPSLPPPCPCASQPPTHLPAPPCPYPSLPLTYPALPFPPGTSRAATAKASASPRSPLVGTGRAPSSSRRRSRPSPRGRARTRRASVTCRGRRSPPSGLLLRLTLALTLTLNPTPNPNPDPNPNPNLCQRRVARRQGTDGFVRLLPRPGQGGHGAP